MELEDDSEVSYWGSCPAEILITVFEYLSAEDLLSCMGVNTAWRANADYWGKKSRKWHLLVEHRVGNKGLNFIQRSKLDFRELYLNCRMWYYVDRAEVKLKHVYNLKGVHNLHVYKDNLIAVCQDRVKFFNIDSGALTKEILEKYLDYQETDYLVAKFSQRENKKHISLCSKHNNETYESLGFRLCHIQHNKCHLTNYKNSVDFFECTPTKFELTRLGRYYSSPRLLCALHMYDDDMYIYTYKGDVYHRRSGELGIKRVCTLDVPIPDAGTPLKKPFMTMFHKCSVVYSVASNEKDSMAKTVDPYGREHLVLLYSDLSCAVQHDDVLLLGFNDGKVGIVLIQNLWITEDVKPVYEFYIQEVAGVRDVEPITCLEVYEADGCHHLFVATKSNLYQVIISEPGYEKVMP